MAYHGIDLQYCFSKVNVILDALSRRMMAIHLIQWSELLEDVNSVDLELILLGISQHYMIIQIRSILNEGFKTTSIGDSLIQMIQEYVEVGMRFDFSIYEDELLCYGNTCISKRKISQEAMIIALSSEYSIHPENTKMYKDLKQHF